MGLPSTVRNCLSSKNLHFQQNFQQLQLDVHVQGEAKLPLRQRGANQQANQHGALRFLCLPIYAYFARDDIALMGFSKRFRDASKEEKEHAESLIDYQNMRGGRVVFREIAKPTCDEWGTALEAIEASLELEKTVNESLLNMHKMADSH